MESLKKCQKSESHKVEDLTVTFNSKSLYVVKETDAMNFNKTRREEHKDSMFSLDKMDILVREKII